MARLRKKEMLLAVLDASTDMRRHGTEGTDQRLHDMFNRMRGGL